MSKRDSKLLITDILEAIEKIENYVANFNYQSFIHDEKTADAVVRNLEVIGEAANRLSQEFKSQNSTVEWNKIVGLRHRIVHDYFGIDLDIIWSILEKDLSKLKKSIQKIR